SDSIGQRARSKPHSTGAIVSPIKRAASTIFRQTPFLTGERRRRANERRIHSVPSQPVETKFQTACRRRGRSLPCLRSGSQIPLRSRTQIHSVRRAKRKTHRLARLSRVRQERHCPGKLSQ